LTRDVEDESRSATAGLGERPQQHEVALHGDQPADAEEPRLVSGIRLDRVPPGDSVVDDLEAVLVEALDLGEVACEPLRDRHVHVRERGDGAIGEAEEAPLAEPVEAVLRGEAQRHSRHRSGDLAVDVRVHEVRVQDARPAAREQAGDLRVRDRVDVGAEADVVERDAARLELPCELPRARLVLVEHEELDVPPAFAQVRQELQ
jgi:hypothetical protein